MQPVAQAVTQYPKQNQSVDNPSVGLVTMEVFYKFESARKSNNLLPSPPTESHALCLKLNNNLPSISAPPFCLPVPQPNNAMPANGIPQTPLIDTMPSPA
eukprot:1496728-Ditylum_brightwellii.AAC.1